MPEKSKIRSAIEESDLLQLQNLGRTTVLWLHAAGIRDRHALSEIGAAGAWLAIRDMDLPATKSLLYALHGALTNRPWRELTEDAKAHLVEQVDRLGKYQSLPPQRAPRRS